MNIVLVRQRPAIGDAVLLSPLITQIKKRYPSSILTVVTDDTYLNGALTVIFEGTPGVDKVEHSAADQWTTESNRQVDGNIPPSSALPPICVQLADIVLDCNGHFVQFERDHGGKPPYGIAEFWLRHHGYFDETASLLPQHRIAKAAQQQFDHWYFQHVPLEMHRKPLVGIVLRAGHTCRDYDYQTLAPQIAEHLYSCGYLPVGIDPVLPLAAAGAISAQDLSLDVVAVLLQRCQLVVTPDTGLLHLAQAVGTQTVALWGIIPPPLRVQDYATTVVPQQSLGYCCDSEEASCRCSWTYQRWSCLKRLTLSMILEAVDKTLEHPTASVAPEEGSNMAQDYNNLQRNSNMQDDNRLVERVAQEVMDRIAVRDRVADLTNQALKRLKQRQSQHACQDRLPSDHTKVQPNRKIILRHFRSPGDVLMLTAAVRDLALSYSDSLQIDVRTPFPALWESNPYLTPLREEDPAVEVLDCDYCDHPLISQSNYQPYHFIHAFRLLLEQRLGVTIPSHEFKADIHLTDQEKSWLSQIDEITKKPGTRFWIIASGGKTDFTAKWWDPDRSQAVVDHFRDRLQFVQVGAVADNHVHPPLDGVINLVGKTDLRQMTRLMYHADGVVCPVTMLMHLAAAVETKPGRPQNRACVVVAGGREPTQWEAYPHHQYLHTLGMLPCCDGGGCWRSRVVALGDGAEQDSSLCLLPVASPSGRILPACLNMITAEHVIDAIERYLNYEHPPQVNLQSEINLPVASTEQGVSV